MNRFIAPAVIAAGATLFAVPAWAVNIPCGASIDAAIQANPPGTTFNLAASCTYTGQAFHTKNNITLLGAGANSTILDGKGAAGWGITDGTSDLTTGVIFDGMTMQNYGGASPCGDNNGFSVMNTWDGWVVRNAIIKNSNCEGIGLHGSATLTNSLVTNNQHDGVLIYEDTTSNHAGVTVSGNEISFNDQGHYDQFVNVAAVKLVASTATTQNNHYVLNNYIHDNVSVGIWSDAYVRNQFWQGNTIINNGSGGILDEISPGPTDISHNVINNNGLGPCYGGSPPILGGGFCYGATVTSGEQIHISSSGNVNTHDNNVLVPSGGDGMWLGVDNRPDAQQEDNVTFNNNTVTFAGTSGSYGYFNNCAGAGGSSCGGPAPTGVSFNNNNIFMSNSINDAHFVWNRYTTPSSFSSYRAFSAQDANSTAQTGNASVSGCTHVGCTGSGWPVVAQTIQSVALSNSTFTPGVPNGTVGTVMVTMNPASPAYSGTLSITGANSGGFHLSGTTLQERPSGTPAGTFSDTNIVAAQSGISAKQITVKITGITEAPFSGTAPSITSTIASTINAVDYDVGGQGLAFSDHSGACGAVPVTTYRTDYVYINSTTDAGSPYKIGCQKVGDYYNYTISVTTPGSYKASMRVANVETGASYHVAIDGKTVASGITVPNTAGYDKFTTVSSTAFSMTAGQHVMTVGVDTVGSSGYAGDFHWIQGTLVAACAMPL